MSVLAHVNYLELIKQVIPKVGKVEKIKNNNPFTIKFHPKLKDRLKGLMKDKDTHRERERERESSQ